MKKSQFIWWLKGYLENETYIGREDVELIKSRLDQVDAKEPTQPGYSTIVAPHGTGTLTISDSSTTRLLND